VTQEKVTSAFLLKGNTRTSYYSLRTLENANIRKKITPKKPEVF